MKEDLMKPRYLIFERWPDMDKSRYYVGQVITLETKENNQWLIDNGKSKLYDAYFDGYPHLFKKLDWFEERPKGFFCEYIKSKSSGTIYKIKSYDIPNGIATTINGRFRTLIDMLPATVQEYNAQNTPLCAPPSH